MLGSDGRFAAVVTRGNEVVVLEHQGTVERFAGDAVMVFFNDPQPLPDAVEDLVEEDVGPAAEDQLRVLLDAVGERVGQAELALAVGVRESKLGLDSMIVNPLPLLKKKGLL